MNERRKRWLEYQYNYLNFSTTKRLQYNKILDTFAKQRHCGSSANYLINVIMRYPIKTREEIMAKMEDIKNSSKDDDCLQILMNKQIDDILVLLEKFQFDKDECDKLYRLMNWKPIIPLTGREEEWEYSGFDTTE